MDKSARKTVWVTPWRCVFLRPNTTYRSSIYTATFFDFQDQSSSGIWANETRWIANKRFMYGIFTLCLVGYLTPLNENWPTHPKKTTMYVIACLLPKLTAFVCFSLEADSRSPGSVAYFLSSRLCKMLQGPWSTLINCDIYVWQTQYNSSVYEFLLFHCFKKCINFLSAHAEVNLTYPNFKVLIKQIKRYGLEKKK